MSLLEAIFFLRGFFRKNFASCLYFTKQNLQNLQFKKKSSFINTFALLIKLILKLICFLKIY